jgi:hypothetical protein
VRLAAPRSIERLMQVCERPKPSDGHGYDARRMAGKHGRAHDADKRSMRYEPWR